MRRYLLTPNDRALQNSSNEVVYGMGSRHWYYPRKEQSVLIRDMSGGALQIKKQKFNFNPDTTEFTEFFSNFIINIFGKENAILLKQHHSQPIISTFVNAINKTLRNFPPSDQWITHRSFNANIDLIGNTIYEDVIIENIEIGVPSQEKPRYKLPGFIKSRYKLTQQGFLFEQVEFSNSVLRNLCLGHQKTCITQEDVDFAQTEEEFFSLMESLYYSEDKELRFYFDENQGRQETNPLDLLIKINNAIEEIQKAKDKKSQYLRLIECLESVFSSTQEIAFTRLDELAQTATGQQTLFSLIDGYINTNNNELINAILKQPHRPSAQFILQKMYEARKKIGTTTLEEAITTLSKKIGNITSHTDVFSAKTCINSFIHKNQANSRIYPVEQNRLMLAHKIMTMESKQKYNILYNHRELAKILSAEQAFELSMSDIAFAKLLLPIFSRTKTTENVQFSSEQEGEIIAQHPELFLSFYKKKPSWFANTRLGRWLCKNSPCYRLDGDTLATACIKIKPPSNEWISWEPTEQDKNCVVQHNKILFIDIPEKNVCALGYCNNGQYYQENFSTVEERSIAFGNLKFNSTEEDSALSLILKDEQLKEKLSSASQDKRSEFYFFQLQFQKKQKFLSESQADLYTTPKSPKPRRNRKLYPNGYDLCLMSNDPKREPWKLYIESTKEGLEYEVIGLDNKLKTATIPWDKLNEFPWDAEKIKNLKNQFLPKLLDVTSNAGHTHPNSGQSIQVNSPITKKEKIQSYDYTMLFLKLLLTSYNQENTETVNYRRKLIDLLINYIKKDIDDVQTSAQLMQLLKWLNNLENKSPKQLSENDTTLTEEDKKFLMRFDKILDVSQISKNVLNKILEDDELLDKLLTHIFSKFNEDENIKIVHLEKLSQILAEQEESLADQLKKKATFKKELIQKRRTFINTTKRAEKFRQKLAKFYLNNNYKEKIHNSEILCDSLARLNDPDLLVDVFIAGDMNLREELLLQQFLDKLILDKRTDTDGKKYIEKFRKLINGVEDSNAIVSSLLEKIKEYKYWREQLIKHPGLLQLILSHESVTDEFEHILRENSDLAHVIMQGFIDNNTSPTQQQCEVLLQLCQEDVSIDFFQVFLKFDYVKGYFDGQKTNVVDLIVKVGNINTIAQLAIENQLFNTDTVRDHLLNHLGLLHLKQLNALLEKKKEWVENIIKKLTENNNEMFKHFIIFSVTIINPPTLLEDIYQFLMFMYKYITIHSELNIDAVLKKLLESKQHKKIKELLEKYTVGYDFMQELICPNKETSKDENDRIELINWVLTNISQYKNHHNNTLNDLNTFVTSPCFDRISLKTFKTILSTLCEMNLHSAIRALFKHLPPQTKISDVLKEYNQYVKNPDLTQQVIEAIKNKEASYLEWLIENGLELTPAYFIAAKEKAQKDDNGKVLQTLLFKSRNQPNLKLEILNNIIDAVTKQRSPSENSSRDSDRPITAIEIAYQQICNADSAETVMNIIKNFEQINCLIKNQETGIKTTLFGFRWDQRKISEEWAWILKAAKNKLLELSCKSRKKLNEKQITFIRTNRYGVKAPTTSSLIYFKYINGSHKKNDEGTKKMAPSIFRKELEKEKRKTEQWYKKTTSIRARMKNENPITHSN